MMTEPNRSLPSGPNGDLDEALSLVCRRFSFRFYLLCPLPEAEATNSHGVMVTNFPPEVLKLFDEAEWWGKFKPILDSMESGRPKVFELKTPIAHAAQAHDERFEAILSSYDVHEAIAFPVHCGSVLGFCGFTAHKVSLQPDEIDWLQIHALGIFDSFCRQRGMVRPQLSARELECLSWTSLGKTSSEVAIILGISEHTVVRHLSSATAKLSAHNRGHAVAKAIRLSLLD